MIHMENVSKTYEGKKKSGLFRTIRYKNTAIQNLSLDLNRGEIVGLLGLNGAGKTTTIRMLSTLLQPTSGSIVVDGLDIERHRKQVQARINMIAGGERMLYWRLTGKENLLYFGRLYGLNSKMAEERANVLLGALGLQDAADIPVEKYSKGMKQRLQIARGLMNNPEYLFLDEPTLGLDAPIARQLRVTVKDLALRKNVGILLTSHYLQEIEELCSRVYVIDKGKLILQGTPQRVTEQVAGHQVIKIQVEDWLDNLSFSLLSDLEIPPEHLCLDGQHGDERTLSIMTASADDLLPRVLTWLSHQRVLIRGISIDKPSLEDAIIHLSEGGPAHESVLDGISG